MSIDKSNWHYETAVEYNPEVTDDALLWEIAANHITSLWLWFIRRGWVEEEYLDPIEEFRIELQKAEAGECTFGSLFMRYFDGVLDDSILKPEAQSFLTHILPKDDNSASKWYDVFIGENLYCKPENRKDFSKSQDFLDSEYEAFLQ